MDECAMKSGAVGAVQIGDVEYDVLPDGDPTGMRLEIRYSNGVRVQLTVRKRRRPIVIELEGPMWVCFDGSIYVDKLDVGAQIIKATGATQGDYSQYSIGLCKLVMTISCWRKRIGCGQR